MAVFHPTSLATQLKGKKVGLVLSAGYFGFFGHAGFLRAVKDAGIEISYYGGTSAGALVAAMAASGMEEFAIGERICEITRGDFWDPDPVGVVRGVLQGANATGILKGERFRTLLSNSLPVKTFEECPKPLLVLATNLTKGAAQVFTRREIAPRVHASCAYPGLFRAVEI
ncbi:MAG: patatin-like phospholipase family protein, partial [Myxococcales bacterium]